MLQHLNNLDRLEPWIDNGSRAWKAVLGIYAANAKGRVRFLMGKGVRATTGSKGVAEQPPKVFAVMEVWVLLHNTNLDEISRDIVEYLTRCVLEGWSDLNIGLL